MMLLVLLLMMMIFLFETFQRRKVQKRSNALSLPVGTLWRHLVCERCILLVSSHALCALPMASFFFWTAQKISAVGGDVVERASVKRRL